MHQKAQFRIYSSRPEPLAQLDAWLDRCGSSGWTLYTPRLPEQGENEGGTND